MNRHVQNTVLLTTLAMFAFAANSVLCRLALAGDNIDAASFTAIRLFSGALVLWLIVTLQQGQPLRPKHNPASALALFIYAAGFSFAYIQLDTGTGALLLFGAVQCTMILTGIIKGDRVSLPEWSGAIVALAGLVYLVFPGLTAPAPLGASLMCTAGIAWGIYSLRGGGDKPSQSTASNFIYAAPLGLLLCLPWLHSLHVKPQGLVLAITSGALTSGLGYVIWYAALKGLSRTRAALIQLSVPVLAALGGVVFLSEALTARLLMAALLILGGIALALSGKARQAQ